MRFFCSSAVGPAEGRPKKFSGAIVGLALIIFALAAPAAWGAPRCYWTSDMSRAYCAPPFGDIVQDPNQEKYYCAPGQCVTNPAGEFRCSAVSGGAAVINSHNRAACVGGCVPPAASLCVRPTP